MPARTIFIIGSSGLVGYSLYRHLVSNRTNESFVLVSRQPHAHNKPIQGVNDLHLCIDCYDSHMLSSSLIKYRPSVIVLSANCRIFPSLLAALELVRSASTPHSYQPRIVLVSTLGSESPVPKYSNVYRYIDSLAFACSYPVCIVKPTLIYGDCEDANISSLLSFCKFFRFYPWLSGFNVGYFQPVFFKDVAIAIAIMVNSDDVGVFNICGPECISYHDFFDEISSSLGFRIYRPPVKFFEMLFQVASSFSMRSSKVHEKLQRLYEFKCFVNSAKWSESGLRLHTPREVIQFMLNH